MFLVSLVVLLPVLYIVWSVSKSYKYINRIEAFFWLPVIQIVSDVAVLAGTVGGLIRLTLGLNYKLVIKNNLGLLCLMAIYIASMLAVINTGIPNQAHPFPYQMDEWHQLQSVRSVFKFGSPNLVGAANGTMFHFFYSGILLIPFIALRILNPFAIKSAVDSIPMQNMLFIVFRLNTLFFGVLTLIVMSKIAKTLKLNTFLAVLLFFLTSAWLTLSNFYKYDIALIFWITLSLLYLIKFSITPTLKNFVISCIVAGLAFSVKVSALPLLPILFLAYLLFAKSKRRDFKILFFGIMMYIFTIIFFGIPDLIFGGRDMTAYLYDNIIRFPSSISNFNLGQPILDFIVFNRLPVIFGHLFYALSVISFVYLFLKTMNDYLQKKYQEFKSGAFLLLMLLVFYLSTLVLGITLAANRALVILPFIVLLCLYFLKDVYVFLQNKFLLRLIFTILLIAFFLVQGAESYVWLYAKAFSLPEQTSSVWILKHIPNGATIGIENIPLYQSEPDFVLKEFYNKQYHPKLKTKYDYTIVNSKSKVLPNYIILSNVYFEKKYMRVSDKINLVARMKANGYKDVKDFLVQLPIYGSLDKNYYTPYFGLLATPESISIFEK